MSRGRRGTVHVSYVEIVGEGTYLEEVEHGEELAGRHDHVVAEPAGDDRVVHDWLVGLVFEVTVPAGAELRAGPLIHGRQLVLRRPDLDACFDAVGGQGTGAVEVPLIEDLLLHRRVATHEVIERLDVRLSSVGGEGEVVVLEVLAHTGEVHERLDARLAQLLWVADARALEDEWRAERAAGDDDLLPGSDDAGRHLAWGEGLGCYDLDAYGAVALEDYFLDLGVGHQVQVLVHGASAVDVAVGGVGATACVAVDPFEPLLSSMAGGQILEIISVWYALRLRGSQEVIFDWVRVIAERDFDGTFETMNVTVVAGALVRLVLLHEWDELVSGPAFCLKVIVVRCRSTCIHL